ncbi:MAG TPA: Stp1/IreP family PP2C-type Ser/Thr phosphatase [Vicinamibacteria bacterium]|jgi:serine/threonine protein phosphatase PrpC|nr:Stp1/IreP family PP2C-type Ser/Thr phosphatase [Vicinamibacteria bacterium]
MKITYEARTDVGRKRKGNEDSLFVNPEQRLFVVADGMGGHAAGEVASKVAVDAINEFVCLTSGDEEITWPFGLDENISYDGNRLKTAIRYANRKVIDATKERSEYEGMATTVAAVLVDDIAANLGHVGDSRAYLLRDGTLSQLTSDHSWVNEQLQNGALSAEQARSHPLRNVVTRALGGKPDLLVDMQSRKMEPGETLLLCSDGLTNMLTDEAIAEICKSAGDDLKKAAQDLVNAANNRGGDDNITVVLVHFEE